MNEIRDYILQKSIEEGLIGGVGSVLAAPVKAVGAGAKFAGRAVAMPFRTAGKAVGTAARTTGNLITLKPKKAVTTLVTGTAGTVKAAVKPATGLAKDTTKIVGDVGRGLAR